MIDETRLARTAAGYGIKLSPVQLAQFSHYATLLEAWNRRINLTAITEPQQVEEKHFIDCLLLAAQPEVAGRVVDVGSGAGFPGMVAKIYKPALDMTLMEPTGKRVKFLEALATALGLPVTVAQARAEEAGRKALREVFDVATARAVAPLAVLCEYCLPLVKVGGWFVAMKADDAEERAAAQSAIETLGGTLAEARHFTLPDGAARSLLFKKTQAATPERYPRNGGVIAKRPLG